MTPKPIIAALAALGLAAVALANSVAIKPPSPLAGRPSSAELQQAIQSEDGVIKEWNKPFVRVKDETSDTVELYENISHDIVHRARTEKWALEYVLKNTEEQAQ